MSEIGYKDLKVLRSIFTVAWHPILIALFIWVCVRYSKGKILITDGYRKDDPGVHGQDPLRGLDLRSTLFPDPEQVCDDVNSEWIYDLRRPDKKVAMYHDIGKGLHIHLQVHPNTTWLKDVENEHAVCDTCGKMGAFDFMGDYICQECLEILTQEEGENHETENI